jgi:hypothetical protein
MSYSIRFHGASDGDDGVFSLASPAAWGAFGEWAKSLPGEYVGLKELTTKGETTDTIRLATEVKIALRKFTPQHDASNVAEALQEALGPGTEDEVATLVGEDEDEEDGNEEDGASTDEYDEHPEEHLKRLGKEFIDDLTHDWPDQHDDYAEQPRDEEGKWTKADHETVLEHVNAHPGRANNIVPIHHLGKSTGFDKERLHKAIYHLRKHGILGATGIEGGRGTEKELHDWAITEGDRKLGYVHVKGGS